MAFYPSADSANGYSVILDGDLTITPGNQGNYNDKLIICTGASTITLGKDIMNNFKTQVRPSSTAGVTIAPVSGVMINGGTGSFVQGAGNGALIDIVYGVRNSLTVATVVGALNAEAASAAQQLTANVYLNGASPSFIRKAFAKVMAGGRSRVGFFGDSTTVGAGAGTNGSGTSGLVGARTGNFCTQLAKLLTAAGYPAFNEARLGNQIVDADTGVTYPQYDPAVALSGFAPTTTGGLTVGGYFFLSNVSGSKWSHTPAMTFDRYDTFSTNNVAATATVDVDGGASLATIGGAGGANVLQKNSVSPTRGTHTTNITLGANANFFVLGGIPYDSTTGGFDFLQLGMWGRKMSDLATNGTAWAPSNPTVLSLLGMDFGVVQMTINDSKDAGTDPESYAASLATVVAAFATAGVPLILMSGIPSNTNRVTPTQRVAIVSKVQQRAATNGLIYLDQDARDISYAYNQTLGWMYDDLHGNRSFYADEARWLARTLIRLGEA